MLSDLYPLLRAVQPADLNTTLNAVATALEGRGEQLGESHRDARRLPHPLQPRAPRPDRGPAADRRGLRHLRRRAARGRDDPAQHDHHHRRRSRTARRSSRRSSTTSRSSPPSPSGSPAPTATTWSASATWAPRSSRSSPSTRPSYPCLLGGIVGAGKLQAEAFRGFTLHIVLETLPNQPRAYGPQDVPVYGDKRGHLLRPAAQPAVDRRPTPSHDQPDFVDGVDEPTGKGTSRVGPGWSGTRRGLRRRPGRVGAAQGAARARARRQRGRRTRPGRAARRPDGARGGGVAAMSPRPGQEDLRRPGQAPGLRRGDLARHRGPGGHDRQPRLRRLPRLQGRVHRRDRRQQGRRHPRRRRPRRHRGRGRDHRPHPRAGHLLASTRARRSTAAPTPRSATATSSASATSRSPRRSATPSGCRPARRSRSRAPGPRST